MNIDLVNKRFGFLLVIEETIERKRGQKLWRCLCDCGNEKLVITADLNGREVSSCGCKRKPENLIGKKFQMLKVLEAADHPEDRKTKQFYWKCLCDCGNIKVMGGNHLRNGIKSCGCLLLRSGSKNYGWKGFGEISGRFFATIKRSADERNLQFNVTIQEIWDLYLKQDRKCALSGLDLHFNFNRKNRINPIASLDRIDSSKNYDLNNIQWIHTDINYMKNDYKQEYFIEMCKNITVNQQIEK